MDLYQKPADGSGEESLLLKSERDKVPTSWSRDGRFLLYDDRDPKTQGDIWVLPMAGDRQPIPFLRTEFFETQGRFSPDGRWIAYVSLESGGPEIYVRPFSPEKASAVSSGGKWMISKGNANSPRWRGDGKEIFFIQSNAQQMALEVSTATTFQAGSPRQLFAFPGLLTSPDVRADGKQFLFAFPEGANAQTPFMVVLNWQAALQQKR